MEIDGRLHILVGADLSGILGPNGLEVARGRGHDRGDLHAPVGGIGGAQVQMQPILMDEGEATVKVKQVLMGRSRANHCEQAGIRILFDSNIAVSQLRILHVLGSLRSDEIPQISQQTQEHAALALGQQIGVAARLDLAGLIGQRRQILDLEPFEAYFCANS